MTRLGRAFSCRRPLGWGDVIRPYLSPVQDAQDTDHSRGHRVRRDIGCSRYDQFSRSCNAPKPTAFRKFGQAPGRGNDLFVDMDRGARIVCFDVGKNRVAIR